MTDKKNPGRKALDAGGNLVTAAGLVVDIGATGGVVTAGVAAGKLMWDAAMAGRGRRYDKHVRAFFERVAEALGEERAAELAVELEQADDAVWARIEEGFRAYMAAINETAKRCIALLVVDYTVRQQFPDREFQLYGKLFADADEPILQSLLTITRQYSEVYDQPQNSLDSDPRGYSYTLLSGKVDDNREIFFHRNHPSKIIKLIESDGESCPDRLELIVRLLERHEFGQVLNNSTPTIPRDKYTTMKRRQHYQSLFIVGNELSARFRRLYDYLSPVFFEPSASEPSSEA